MRCGTCRPRSSPTTSSTRATTGRWPPAALPGRRRAAGDDIQFPEGKEGTQRSSSTPSTRCTTPTSDRGLLRPPAEGLAHPGGRLRTVRVGLITDIHRRSWSPIAILQEGRAGPVERAGRRAEFIASRIERNIRELGGADPRHRVRLEPAAGGSAAGRDRAAPPDPGLPDAGDHATDDHGGDREFFGSPSTTCAARARPALAQPGRSPCTCAGADRLVAAEDRPVLRPGPHHGDVRGQEDPERRRVYDQAGADRADQAAVHTPPSRAPPARPASSGAAALAERTAPLRLPLPPLVPGASPPPGRSSGARLSSRLSLPWSAARAVDAKPRSGVQDRWHRFPVGRVLQGIGSLRNAPTGRGRRR